MIRTFLVMMLLLPLCVLGQSKIGKTKEEVKKELKAWSDSHKNYAPKIAETATGTTLSIRDPQYGNVQFTYKFNKEGLCLSEKTKAFSAEARSNYLNSVLEQNGYGWKKINGNQYISKFSDKLMIELPGDAKDLSFTVYRVEWTQELYDMLNKQ